MKPRPAADDQRAKMRGCLHSVCEPADDMTPVYLCDKPRKKASKQLVCRLYKEECSACETFPELFDT